jgi:hypothetical protein
MFLFAPLLPARTPVMLTDTHLDALRERLQQQQEPTWTAWLGVKKEADAALDFTPTVPEVWFVPGYYGKQEQHRKAKGTLQDSANHAYTLALAFHMTREPRYAEKSADILRAWMRLEQLKTGADSSLSFSYHFPAMIFAADLLRRSDVWTETDERNFTTFLREKALPMNTMNRKNNWGNWGLVLYAAIGAYLEDGEMINTAEKRWREFIDRQIAADGHMHDEVKRNGGRSGLWYSHFSLFPQTLAAEILRLQGRDVYGTVGKDGRSLELAYRRIAPWVNDPASFPYYSGDTAKMHGVERISYFEILYPRWPDPAAAEALKRNRPLTQNHSLPHCTFTHGQPLEAHP